MVAAPPAGSPWLEVAPAGRGQSPPGRRVRLTDGPSRPERGSAARRGYLAPLCRPGRHAAPSRCVGGLWRPDGAVDGSAPRRAALLGNARSSLATLPRLPPCFAAIRPPRRRHCWRQPAGMNDRRDLWPTSRDCPMAPPAAELYIVNDTRNRRLRAVLRSGADAGDGTPIDRERRAR